VDTASHQENASRRDSEAAFKFRRIGNGSGEGRNIVRGDAMAVKRATPATPSNQCDVHHGGNPCLRIEWPHPPATSNGRSP
jgi:hypothetical protein